MGHWWATLTFGNSWTDGDCWFHKPQNHQYLSPGTWETPYLSSTYASLCLWVHYLHSLPWDLEKTWSISSSTKIVPVGATHDHLEGPRDSTLLSCTVMVIVATSPGSSPVDLAGPHHPSVCTRSEATAKTNCRVIHIQLFGDWAQMHIYYKVISAAPWILVGHTITSLTNITNVDYKWDP